MKREIRRDARIYKDNKAKLRKMKEQHIKRKMESKEPASGEPIPARKVRKLTEGLPQGLKAELEMEKARSGSYSLAPPNAPISRHIAPIEPKRAKSSAFAAVPPNTLPATPIALTSPFTLGESSLRPAPSARPPIPCSSLTQSIVSKLPSIGHKFIGDTEKLIMKNTIKPIQSVELTSPALNPAAWITPNHSLQSDKSDQLLDHQDSSKLQEQQQPLPAHHDLQDAQQSSAKKSNLSTASFATKPYVAIKLNDPSALRHCIVISFLVLRLQVAEADCQEKENQRHNGQHHSQADQREIP